MMGSSRQAFMRACLSGKRMMINTQQQRMKDCNAQARVKGLSGDRRKAFISSCLRRG
jgi:hypothetical protein